MRAARTIAALLVVTTTAVAPGARAQAGPEPRAAPFVAERTQTLPSGRRLAIVWRERRCRSGECEVDDGGLWGVDGDVPEFVTDLFRVTLDGRELPVPRKFYRDLTNTRSLVVEERQRRVTVAVRGGAAAGAFQARFTFDGCGFERVVCGEVCSEVEERSRWRSSFVYADQPGCRSGLR